MSGGAERLGISVIIPTYNRRSLVKRAVESVLLGERLPEEIVVVDDGSTDRTSEELRGIHPLLRLIRCSTNRGVAAARNLGIGCTRHPWLALLDSDDVWLPSHLRLLEQYVSRRPGCRVVQTRERWYRKGARVNPSRRHLPLDGDLFEGSLQRCLVSSSAVLLHREVVDQVGGYDQRLPVCEDYDLWLRIARTRSFGLVDEESIEKWGPRDDQLSHRYWGMDRFRVFALVKLLSQPLSVERFVSARAVCLKKLAVLANGAKKRAREDSLARYEQWVEVVSTCERTEMASIQQVRQELESPPFGLPRLLVEAGIGADGWSNDPILGALSQQSCVQERTMGV